MEKTHTQEFKCILNVYSLSSKLVPTSFEDKR